MVGSLVEGWGEQRVGSVSFELISPQPTKTNMCVELQLRPTVNLSVLDRVSGG